MRKRRVRILHEGHEYYLVDRGRTPSARTITLLKRLEQDGASAGGAVLVRTDIGDCLAIARWSGGAVDVAEGHESLREMFQQVVDRYLEEFRVGRAARAGKPHFFLSAGRLPLYTLARAQPDGLSVLVFSSREGARRAAAVRQAEEQQPIEVEEAGDLADYLAARATEGFAGAMLDDADPIFFCLDETGMPRFLRLKMDAARNRVEHLLLDSSGSWSAYEGEEEILPEIDQEAADRYMVDRLGDVPFFGFRAGMRFCRLARLGDSERPVAIELADEPIAGGQPFCPLFHDPEQGKAFLDENRLEGYEPVVVDDLRSLAAWCRLERRVLILQPDGHRARGGTLWLDGERVVLDSFSGLWYSTDGVHFERD
ncbi:MAG: hypothetical protein HY812_00675 [Planctomycetes bacterium]|nr:hypothetical protein [Planctomycetota bacterium]